MNWEYPDEIVPTKDRWQVIRLGLILGISFRATFLFALSLFPKSMSHGDGIAETNFAAAILCLVLGFGAGCFAKTTVNLHMAPLHISLWAALIATIVFGIPEPAVIAAAVFSLVLGIPFSAIAGMVIGICLGRFVAQGRASVRI